MVKPEHRFCKTLSADEPQDLVAMHDPAECVHSEHNTKISRAVFNKNKRWTTGQDIKIAFVGGSDAQRAEVKKYAVRWTRYANLNFVFDATIEESDVRVSFEKGKGSWSYIGNDATRIPKDRATMNLGWRGRGTILHEFGHMLGLSHSHQSPAGGFTWKRDVVIKALSGPPNNWDESKIEHNVLKRYSKDNKNLFYTDLDTDSAMMYFFPAEWNEEGIKMKNNNKLSRLDKFTVMEMYKGRDTELDDEQDAEKSDDSDWSINGNGTTNSDDDESSEELPGGCCGVFAAQSQKWLQKLRHMRH